MAFREVSVVEVRGVLRVWLGVAGLPDGLPHVAARAAWTADRPPLRRRRAGGWVVRDDGDGVSMTG